MRIVMLGTGYVGLVSGACFAEFGHSVVCIDKDPTKLQALEAGRIPIYEPGLDQIITTTRKAGRLTFCGDLKPHLTGADIIFLAVGTPTRRGDGFADLTYVYEAAREIARAATSPLVVVTKSTVPVGTGDEIERILLRERPELSFSVASNPEFLREGSAIEDFKRPDRIIIGCNDERGRQILTEVYRPLYLNQLPLVVTDRRTAEIIKYAANAFLATKISFINEIADLCERVGADVQAVARGIGLDNRIGSKFLHAGPGFGGSCLPKDTLALVKTAQDFEAPLRIVEAVIAVNNLRKRTMVRKIIAACGGSVRDKTIAVLGLTFKPNTDDMREAPSLAIITGLEDAGAKVRAYDPVGLEQARPILPNVELVTDAYQCLNGADAMVIITEWNEFRALDLEQVKKLLKSPVVVDLRNIYRPQEMAGLGFTYVSVGRQAV